jgi:hypothetical protein
MISEPLNPEAVSDRTLIVRETELECKSTDELFASTVEGEYDDDAAQAVIRVLQLRGTPDVFEVARLYCESGNPIARARGLSVMAQLGAGKPDADRPWISKCVGVAIEHLKDPNAEVVRCAAWVLSNLGTPSGVSALFELCDNSDSEVRLAVACCIDLRSHPAATDVLVALMEDTDEEIRDWATFALASGRLEKDGVLHYADSPTIRAALLRRLEDPYEDARHEAIWGLAARKEPVGIELLLSNLQSEDCWRGDNLAAEEILNLTQDSTTEELCDGLRYLLSDVSKILANE